MKNFMIDIETLDTEPSCVILSLGLVSFDMQDRFFARLTIQSQLDQGRTIGEDTLLWWMRQNKQAMAMAFHPDDRVHSNEALLRVNQIVGGGIVWAKDPSFDCIALRALYKQGGIEPSWSFRNERSVRTMMDFLPGGWQPSDIGELVDHDPVHDCRYQIAAVRDAHLVIGRNDPC